MFGHFSSSVTDIGEFYCIFMGDRGVGRGEGHTKSVPISKIKQISKNKGLDLDLISLFY